MGLVILAALCVAGFALLFRTFDRHAVPLFPAIAVNYAVAFCCGLALHPPWGTGDLSLLWSPAAFVGTLFVVVFWLMGLSAQRAGAARTTIAARMSLVLTVLVTIRIFHEPVSALVWTGIGLALLGVVLTTAPSREAHGALGWLLPLVIFLGSGAADIVVNAAQRTRTTSLNEGVFTTLCFGACTAAAFVGLLLRRELGGLRHLRVWVGGGLLGVVNYGSLYLLVGALGRGVLPASRIFPLMNIGAILFATLGGIVLFGERLSPRQWVGIGLCMASLIVILSTAA